MVTNSHRGYNITISAQRCGKTYRLRLLAPQKEHSGHGKLVDKSAQDGLDESCLAWAKRYTQNAQYALDRGLTKDAVAYLRLALKELYCTGALESMQNDFNL